MDYEKKYKALVEAVKILKEANPSDEGIQNWVNDNVPELQESEDEKLNHWKPTEAQMNSLAYIIIHPNEGNKSDYSMLQSLYKDLQRIE